LNSHLQRSRLFQRSHDRDHDQQLDQRETSSSAGHQRHLLLHIGTVVQN
jgi:hypothetical protein